MTMEVRELLSQAVLDTPGHVSGSSIPKRLEPMVLVTPLPPKLEDFPKLVDTSCQVGTPDDDEMEDPTPEDVHATYSPTIETPGPSSDIPPPDIAHLWEEANKALGDWLVIKSSIDACQWNLVSKFGVTLPKQVQNQEVHQGSKGSLHLFHQGSRGQLCSLYQGSRGPLLISHQGGRGSGSFSSQFHSTMTCQRHSAS